MYDKYIEIEGILYYFVRFVIPLFLAEIISFGFAKKKKYRLGYFLSFSLLFLAISAFLVYFQVDIKIGWFRFIYIIIFVLSIIPFLLSIDMKISGIVFFAVAAYAVQNLSDNLWMLILKFFDANPSNLLEWGSFGLVYLFVYIIYFLVIFIFIRKNYLTIINNMLVLIMAIVSLSIVYVLSMYAQEIDEFSAFICIRIYTILVCAFILIIQFSIFRNKRLKDYKDMLENIINSENEKLNQSRESMELISMHCHDLKHQIAAIQSMNLNPKQQEIIKDLSSNINAFDSRVKTGNSILDILINERNLLIKRRKILFSPIIDGKALNFMSNSDIYVLFGNLLDNAIDANKNEKETNRFLNLKVITKSNFIFIKIDNPCSTDVVFKDGLPQTTKEGAFHGYGAKSIEYITKKYNGTLKFQKEKDIFSVTIWFRKATN